jgi:NAD(P)-dependent dehydrogenase (short-subunit alcohol dehydrogenase family)
MVQDLHGKWVLLSGAASGIGKETCLLLANEGANFVIIDIDEDGLRVTADQLESLGSKVIWKVVDVTKKEQIQELAAEVTGKIGTVDVLVNNAGIGHNQDLRHTSDDTWKRLMAINFFAVLDMVNAFLPSMIAKGGGQIVNMSTGQVFFPVPTWGAYAASKAALATYSECLTWELAHQHAVLQRRPREHAASEDRALVHKRSGLDAAGHGAQDRQGHQASQAQGHPVVHQLDGLHPQEAVPDGVRYRRGPLRAGALRPAQGDQAGRGLIESRP